MAGRPTAEHVLINLLLVVSVVVFAVGLWAPILTLKKLIFLENTFSVLSGIAQLVRDRQYGLFLIVAAFTLVLPCCKIAVLFTAWNSALRRPAQNRYLRWLALLGKWSMLDVFVVAVLIASVQLGPIATVEIHYGLYLFAAAVVLIMVDTQVVYQRTKNRPRRGIETARDG